jgi:fructosamine-3-kinase
MQTHHLKEALDETFDTSVTVDRLERVSGGDINEAAIAHTSEGELFVKWNRDGIEDLFEREFEALEEMREAETNLTIPEPLCHRPPASGRPGFIVMEYLETGPRVSDFDERLGRGLAQLHEHSAEQFGFEHDNYCGTTPQPNDWRDDWVDFYRDQRLRHQLELAVDRRSVSEDDREAFEALLVRLDEFVGPAPESPSLIHGDLWSGNLHVGPDGTPALIDPAVYYGHPEAEIGMMELFGGFSSRVYNAYREVRSLPSGWRDRLSLYQLYHVMNHYNLFGGHWGGQAFDIVRKWV